MKRLLLAISVCAILISLLVPNSGCTKTKTTTDTVTKTVHDTTVVRDTTTDTLKVPYDTTYRHINDSLWAYFKLDGNLADSSGNNHTLTLNNTGVALGYDMWGNPSGCLDFTGGSAAYGLIQDGGSFDAPNFTVSLFAQYRAQGGYLFTKTNWADATGTTYTIGQDPTSYLDTIRIALGTTPDICSTPASSGIPVKNTVTTQLGAWYHVVMTFSNGVCDLYVNGTLVNTYQFSQNTLDVCSNAGFILGNWWSLDNRPAFNGKLDDIRVYTRAITAHEVSYLYKHFMTK